MKDLPEGPKNMIPNLGDTTKNLPQGPQATIPDVGDVMKHTPTQEGPKGSVPDVADTLKNLPEAPKNSIPDVADVMKHTPTQEGPKGSVPDVAEVISASKGSSDSQASDYTKTIPKNSGVPDIGMRELISLSSSSLEFFFFSPGPSFSYQAM
jgi:hypothetical protein